MNYEEESDHDLAISVIYAGDSSLNDLTFYDEILCGHSSKASIYDRDSSDLVKSFDVNNPADWGKLMEDNKIHVIHNYDCDGEVTALKDNADRDEYEFFHTDNSVGRAISICYLKLVEANNNEI